MVIIIFICILYVGMIDKKKKRCFKFYNFIYVYLFFVYWKFLILLLFFVLLISNNNNFFKLLINVFILIVDIVLKLLIELLI